MPGCTLCPDVDRVQMHYDTGWCMRPDASDGVLQQYRLSTPLYYDLGKLMTTTCFPLEPIPFRTQLSLPMAKRNGRLNVSSSVVDAAGDTNTWWNGTVSSFPSRFFFSTPV
ncbi:hypothetical protein QCA50_003418 [Cerrena zonata]|uniref:Uncharacterized protein n=1 Tax=Cerrena zonata TaxID=2478898 RepID=A0AAW0GK94_9APHY